MNQHSAARSGSSALVCKVGTSALPQTAAEDAGDPRSQPQAQVMSAACVFAAGVSIPGRAEERAGDTMKVACALPGPCFLSPHPG